MLLSSRVLTPGALLLQRRRNNVPLWLQLVQAAEQAARDAGASLWYVPPEQYAPRAVNGPFVGSGGSGGVPAVGSGVVGWLRDGAAGPVSSPNLVTNGGPFTDTIGWGSVFNNVSVSVSSGALRATSLVSGVGARVVSFQMTDLTPGRTYTFQARLVGSGGTAAPSAAACRLQFMQANGTAMAFVTYSSFGEVLVGAMTANASTHLVGVRCDPSPSADTTTFFEINDIAVREIPGSHATQATSANRPVLVAAPGAAAAAAGFGALSFDGTNDFLSIASGLTDANTFTVVGSAILTSSIPEGQLYTQRDPAAANPIIGQLDFTNGRLRSVSRGTTGTPVELIQTPSQAYVNTPVVATSRNSAARAIRELRVNGALEVSKGLVSVSAITPNATIGAALSQTQSYFVGSIGMIARMPIDAPAAILEPIERLGAFIVGAPYPGL